MSYDQWEWIQLSKEKWVCSGWYVDNVQSIDMQPYFSPYARNFRIKWQSVEIRPWHILFATLQSGDYPRGIGRYLRTTSSNDRLVVRHNISWTQKLYTIDEAGSATAITTSSNIASDNRMSFTNIGDVIYCMNGSDNFWKLSWTTYSTPSTWISNFAPSFSVTFNWSHRASGWSSNPTLVYKSVADNYEDFNSSWSDQFSFWENITWLASNDQALYYFTKNTISVTGANDILDVNWTLTYNTRSLDVTEWAINNSSIVPFGNRVFYVTPNNQIRYLEPWVQFDGKDSIPLSHREYEGIDNYMEALDDDQSDCWAYALPKENIIKFFFKSPWATFHDQCVSIYVKWTSIKFMPDTNKYFYDGTYFKNGKSFTVSGIEPKVYRDEYAYDDEDAPIPFEYWSKEFYVSGATWKNVLWWSRTLIDVNELANPTQYIYLDGSQVDEKTIDWADYLTGDGGIWTFDIGTEPIGTWWLEEEDMVEVPIIRTKGNLNEKWRKVQRRFENTTVGGKMRIKDFTPRVERLPDLANSI